jgi:hypothetical protein
VFGQIINTLLRNAQRNCQSIIAVFLFSNFEFSLCITRVVIQCVPLATEPGIEDIANKFEQEYVRCVRNEGECFCNVCL